METDSRRVRKVTNDNLGDYLYHGCVLDRFGWLEQ